MERIESQKEALEDQCRDLQRRIDADNFRQFDRDLVQENLRQFNETFSRLTDDEKPECLGLILKDVTLGRETVQLNIFDFPEFNYADSSKKRTEKAPLIGQDPELSLTASRLGKTCKSTARDQPRHDRYRLSR